MNFPIVPEYRDDIMHVNPDNEVRGEPFKMAAGVFSRIVIPLKSPFFVKSLRVYNGNREPLTLETDDRKGDYRIYKIMAGLTELTAAPVACMVEFTNQDITSGFFDYDVVGEFSLFDAALMAMIIDSGKDDRPVWWEYLRGKPPAFRPKLHGMSLIYDIVAFKDTISLLDSILAYMDANSRTIAEIKIDHYVLLLKHYLAVYSTELLNNLNRHMGSYNSHGFNKVQSGLSLVDNFATARGNDLLKPHSNMHLTPNGLKTIINSIGFNANELLENGKIAISQFGNSNFIPPSLDGSFEGLGGKIETAGITMENDGSIALLWNRMDGRIDGLYYSVVENPYSNLKLTYTSYRYTHQRLVADDINPDVIANGTGKDVIMVGDTRKQRYYIGVTNGTLDPSKHVYSEINLDAMKVALGNQNANLGSSFGSMNIFLTGDWIYITLATHILDGSVDANNPSLDLRYRYFYRVPVASVRAQINVTAEAVRLTYTDGDGASFANATHWCWGGSEVAYRDPISLQWLFNRYYFKFKVPMITSGYYRSQHSYVEPIPDKPGKFILKMTSAFYILDVNGVGTPTMNFVIDMTYEFDPNTGVMVLLSKTPNAEVLDPQAPPDLNATLFLLNYLDSNQGSVVLDDGSIIAGGGSYQSFPRNVVVMRTSNFRTRYDILRRNWNTEMGLIIQANNIVETLVSPLKSSIMPKSMLLGNGGDAYVAATGENINLSKVYYRQSAGKLAPRANVDNLFYNNVVSRPLSNAVWEVNALPYVGGAYVTTPSAQLDSYGTDLGEFTFCMGCQKQFLNLTGLPGDWPVGSNPEDIMLKTRHANRVEADGTLTFTNNGSILYPAAIVDLLKREVDDVAKMLACPKTFVAVCDPSAGPLTEKYGWLPVLVMINWAEVGTLNRRGTLLSIQPTYSVSGNDRTVTGYTVLDKKHVTWANTAYRLTPTSWDATLGGYTTGTRHGAMRCGFYVNGTSLIGFLDSGVQAVGVGDSLQTFARFNFNRTTQRWADASTILGITGQGGSANHTVVTPDNGVILLLPWSSSTGGAGSLYNGGVNNPLLASVYPEVGWTIFAQAAIKATFQGKSYTIPAGTLDLRDVSTSPGNKTFYIYALLRDGIPQYEVAEDKRLETPFRLWVGKVVTGASQILTIERFNVFVLNGNRVSEIKRGNCIPASSGLANSEGQLPWLRNDELLP